MFDSSSRTVAVVPAFAVSTPLGPSLIALLCASLACAPVQPPDPDAAPTLTGKSLDGEYWSLEDARGKVLLVNVWATWCAPCRNELPMLSDLHKRYGGPDFEVIGVSVDKEGDHEKVRNMAGRFSLPYRIVLDPQKRVTLAWKVGVFPTSVLLDRKGHVLSTRKGEIKAGDKSIESEIQEAIKTAPKSGT